MDEGRYAGRAAGFRFAESISISFSYLRLANGNVVYNLIEIGHTYHSWACEHSGRAEASAWRGFSDLSSSQLTRLSIKMRRGRAQARCMA